MKFIAWINKEKDLLEYTSFSTSEEKAEILEVLKTVKVSYIRECNKIPRTSKKRKYLTLKQVKEKLYIWYELEAD